VCVCSPESESERPIPPILKNNDYETWSRKNVKEKAPIPSNLPVDQRTFVAIVMDDIIHLACICPCKSEILFVGGRTIPSATIRLGVVMGLILY
jgi:hypothetical protein